MPASELEVTVKVPRLVTLQEVADQLRVSRIRFGHGFARGVCSPSEYAAGCCFPQRRLAGSLQGLSDL